MTTPGRHWQYWAGFVLGLWLAVSPWVAGYVESDAATANAVFVGLLVALGLHFHVVIGATSGKWLGAGAGLWLLAAPFVLALEGVAAAAAVSVGGLLTALSASLIAPFRQDVH